MSRRRGRGGRGTTTPRRGSPARITEAIANGHLADGDVPPSPGRPKQRPCACGEPGEPRGARVDGHRRSLCDECYAQLARKWEDEVAERVRRLELRYGTTEEVLQGLYVAQLGLCAICGGDGLLVVDHDHDTGAVRGLLCRGCNVGIGFLSDDPQVVGSAADYLRRRKGDGVRVVPTGPRMPDWLDADLDALMEFREAISDTWSDEEREGLERTLRAVFARKRIEARSP